MLWMVFIQAITGLLNLIGRSVSQLFLVFEAAFGICLGCVAVKTYLVPEDARG